MRRVVAAAAVIAVTLVVPSPARAAVICQRSEAPAPVAAGVPAEDQVYAPKRLAGFATGRGVRVAVIDSGVDAAHPQLRGHVTPGADFLHGDDNGRQDCNGHGTAVASIIGAMPARNTGFQGLAPGVAILPLRISEQEVIDGKAVGDKGTPAQFAQAIDLAVDQGADVINISLVMTSDNAAVRAAVARAIGAGVVVVAAAGNDALKGNPDPFPAKYPGVIGVGAVQFDGTVATYSQRGDYVDLVAIGNDVTAAAAGGTGHSVRSGTSFAAPFVAATAALILQRFPQLSPGEVRQRLIATTDPAPGGSVSAEYGFGLLNPYRALTETLGPRQQARPAPAAMTGDDPAAAALAARRAESQDRALLFAAVVAGIVLLLALTAIIVRQGRRRGWHPATSQTSD
ncbi:type VII secretion-associated serine protease mycosin [Paractinoplanes atraurantiacus]|uniref:Type VII secretion-associated serine protease mycosin n=1 Tax=Paractinoplanes atraurantiacus TaxID=1036182 RepID=A0A285IC15_9ACTN|nr:type VII secretion-associated serine protease mycosin [Actinoplanes atraurantiacus]SNY45327.1 type VII secretion-associated serine protease mycosin [Actinoplanes atraurantiacus]